VVLYATVLPYGRKTQMNFKVLTYIDPFLSYLRSGRPSSSFSLRDWPIGFRFMAAARKVFFFFFPHRHTVSGAHPPSCPVATGGSRPVNGATGARLTTRARLVSRSGMRGAVPPLPMRLHGMVLSYAQGRFTF
jgi:hypothetical protein